MADIEIIKPATTGGGGGTVNTLDNGLTLTGTNGQLGGALVKDTGITNGAFDLSFDRLLLGGVTVVPSFAGKSGIFVGDSITFGNLANPITLGFSYLMSANLGITQVNIGRSGTTLGNPARTDPLVDNLSLIPNKSGVDLFLMIEYGINDVSVNGAYTDTDFGTDYHTVIDYAIAHGWPAADIICWTIPWITPNGTFTTPILFQARMDAFNAQIQALATDYPGLTVYDAYSLIFNNGQFVLQASDHYHPNNQGHYLLSQGLTQLYLTSVYNSGQSLVVNGVTALENLNLPYLNLIPTNGGALLGRKSDGSIGQMASIPGGTLVSGNIILDGGVYQSGALAPDGSFTGGLKNGDSLYNGFTRLVSTFNDPTNIRTDFWAYFELIDNSGATRLVTSLGDFFIFIGLDGGNNPITSFQFHKTWTHSYHDLFVDSGLQFYSASVGTGPTGGFYAGYIPVNTDSSSRFYNEFAPGSMEWLMSNGTNGQRVPVMRLGNTGRLLIQNTGAVLLDTPAALLAVKGNNGGFIMPSLTTAQRDVLSSVAAITVIAAGTGYTSAPTITIGAPPVGGTQATATAVVSGGGVTQINIINPGQGYLTTPSITIGGPGTGAGAILVINLEAPLMIYNTDILKFQYFNGTTWITIDTSANSSVPLITTFAQSALSSNTTLANITTSANTDFMRISVALYAALTATSASIQITWTDQTFTVQTLVLPGIITTTGTANIPVFTVQCAPSSPLKVDLIIAGASANCTVGGSIERVAQM